MRGRSRGRRRCTCIAKYGDRGVVGRVGGELPQARFSGPDVSGSASGGGDCGVCGNGEREMPPMGFGARKYGASSWSSAGLR